MQDVLPVTTTSQQAMSKH